MCADCVDDDFHFESAIDGLLDDLCERGYFDDGKPEDDLIADIYELSVWELSLEEQRLFDARILPVLKAAFYEPSKVDEVYQRLRPLPWPEPDPNQLDLFKDAA